MIIEKVIFCAFRLRLGHILSLWAVAKKKKKTSEKIKSLIVCQITG